MSVLIVDALAANEGRRKYSRDVIGVGPRLVAGICEKKGIPSKIARVEDLLDSNTYFSSNTFSTFLISAMSVDEIAVRRIIKQIKHHDHKAKIVLGGPILSEEKILKDLDIYAGVYGEAEWILEDLTSNEFNVESLFDESEELPKYNIRKIFSSWFLTQNKHTEKEIFDDFHPSVDRITDYPDHWYSKVYVEITRGCSNHFRGSIAKKSGGCSDCGNCDDPDTILTGECPEHINPGCGFCSVPATFGPPRSKKINTVLHEVDQLFKKGIRRIKLSSPGFLDFFRGEEEQNVYSPTQPPANIEKITVLLKKLAEIRDGQESPCSISIENVKPSLVTKEIAELIGKYLPHTSISIGCETFDSQHSEAIGRPSNPEQALKAAKHFANSKISPQIYLIHSLPGETVTSLEKTKNVVDTQLHNYAEKITVYKYLPLPNSPFTVTQTKLPPERHLLKTKREELKKAIIKFNYSAKEKLKGSILTVIVAERDRKRGNTFICYPIFSGPAISICSSKDILGHTLEVRVTKAITDKLLEGEIS